MAKKDHMVTFLNTVVLYSYNKKHLPEKYRDPGRGPGLGHPSVPDLGLS